MSCRRFAPLVLALVLAAPSLAQSPPTREPTKPPAAAAVPGSPAPLQPGDAFGEAVNLKPKTILFLKGQTTWDAAFDTLVDSFKSLNASLAKQGITPSGPPMAIYTQIDETGFQFQAAVPVAAAPTKPLEGGVAAGETPTGKALKFVHRGSYDAMNTTYEALTNYIEDKGLEARDLFVEEYLTDPVKADPNALVVNVFVPIK